VDEGGIGFRPELIFGRSLRGDLIAPGPLDYPHAKPARHHFAGMMSGLLSMHGPPACDGPCLFHLSQWITTMLLVSIAIAGSDKWRLQPEWARRKKKRQARRECHRQPQMVAME